MQVAFDSQEFSFMLAGVLVASAAGAVVFVYCLMNSSLGYLINLEEGSYLSYYQTAPLVFSDPVAIASGDDMAWLTMDPMEAP